MMMIGRVQLIQLEGCDYNPTGSYSMYAQEREVIYIPKDQANASSLQSEHSQNINPNASFLQQLEMKNKHNSSLLKENIAKISFHSKAKSSKLSGANQSNSFSKNYYYNGR